MRVRGKLKKERKIYIYTYQKLKFCVTYESLIHMHMHLPGVCINVESPIV